MQASSLAACGFSPEEKMAREEARSVIRAYDTEERPDGQWWEVLVAVHMRYVFVRSKPRLRVL